MTYDEIYLCVTNSDFTAYDIANMLSVCDVAIAYKNGWIDRERATAIGEIIINC